MFFKTHTIGHFTVYKKWTEGPWNGSQGPFHTTPEKFENEALFLRLGLPSATIRINWPLKTALFENALQSGGIWRRRLCVLVWTESILKTELFENNDVTIIIWLNLLLKGALKSFRRRCLLRFQISPCVDGKYLMRLQSEKVVFKFLRCSVDEA